MYDSVIDTFGEDRIPYFKFDDNRSIITFTFTIKKLNCRRATVQQAISVELLPNPAQLCSTNRI